MIAVMMPMSAAAHSAYNWQSKQTLKQGSSVHRFSLLCKVFIGVIVRVVLD